MKKKKEELTRVKKKDRTAENRRNYLKHKEAIRAKQRTYRDKNKNELSLKRLNPEKKLSKAAYDFNRRNGTNFTVEEYKKRIKRNIQKPINQ